MEALGRDPNVESLNLNLAQVKTSKNGSSYSRQVF